MLAPIIATVVTLVLIVTIGAIIFNAKYGNNDRDTYIHIGVFVLIFFGSAMIFVGWHNILT